VKEELGRKGGCSSSNNNGKSPAKEKKNVPARQERYGLPE
jgi:hypothetical protein